MSIALIQPSSDPKATAMAIAWQLCAHLEMRGPGCNDPEVQTKKKAALIGSLAQAILAGSVEKVELESFDMGMVAVAQP